MSYKDDQTLRDLNKALDGLDKELREKKRQELNTRFALGAEILRKDGTKERKIQEIFKRTYETWRQARDTPPDDPEIRSGHRAARRQALRGQNTANRLAMAKTHPPRKNHHPGWRPGHGQITARHQYRRLYINRTPNARRHTRQAG